jgi:hypothetical protein
VLIYIKTDSFTQTKHCLTSSLHHFHYNLFTHLEVIATKLLTSIQEMFGSNLGWDVNYLDGFSMIYSDSPGKFLDSILVSRGTR